MVNNSRFGYLASNRIGFTWLGISPAVNIKGKIFHFQ